MNDYVEARHGGLQVAPDIGLQVVVPESGLHVAAPEGELQVVVPESGLHVAVPESGLQVTPESDPKSFLQDVKDPEKPTYPSYPVEEKIPMQTVSEDPPPHDGKPALSGRAIKRIAICVIVFLILLAAGLGAGLGVTAKHKNTGANSACHALYSPLDVADLIPSIRHRCDSIHFIEYITFVDRVRHYGLDCHYFGWRYNSDKHQQPDRT